MGICVLGMLGSQAYAEKKIGMLVWSEDPHYREAAEGFKDEMTRGGFGDGKASYTIENAQGDKTRVAEIAKKFAAAKFDMIVPVGTSAAVAAAKEIKETPIVFCVVYDPVDSKIAQDWKSSGNNTTGSSSKVPMSVLVEKLKKLASVKNLAVLYTPGEKNSEAQLKDLQAVESQFNTKIVPVPISSREEVIPIVTDVVGRVEAIFLSGSSIVGDAVSAITETATKAKVLTVTHQGEKVEKGVLLGVYADSRALGRLAGQKAVHVLKGAKPSSIPIESLAQFDMMLNMKTAHTGNIAIPADFLKEVSHVIE